MTRRAALTLLLTVAMWTGSGPHAWGAQPPPAGEVVIAFAVTLAPTWFDPAETPAQITPFAFLYALHDGLVRPLPGARLGNSLAASWSESPDGLVYTFTLRPGLRFHNGDPCTAEDVQFSFERYKGNGATELHAKVQRVEVVDALTVRFYLHAPWPDFLTFYGTTATAAGLVVPKHYLQQVGEDGFKHHPIGLGPYRFLRHTPGIELVLEAVVNALQAVGIRVRMRPMDRAAFYTAWREKKLCGLIVTASGAAGNAATRVEAFISSQGTYAYGGYPEIDALLQQQAGERDRVRREALLHQIQQRTVERVMFAPLLDFRALHGIGPRVAEHTINAIPLYPFPVYEDLQLKAP